MLTPTCRINIPDGLLGNIGIRKTPFCILSIP